MAGSFEDCTMSTYTQAPNDNNDGNELFSIVTFAAVFFTVILAALSFERLIDYRWIWVPCILYFSAILLVIILANYSTIYIKIRKFFRRKKR
jgi:hypothetical protein